MRHLVNPQNLNRYAYVTNNPLRFFDPDGLEKLEVIVRTFIPPKAVAHPVPVKGDGRKAGEKGTHRTEWRVTIETNSKKNNGSLVYGEPRKDVGVSFGAGIDRSAPPFTGVVPLLGIKSGQGSGDTLKGEVSRVDSTGIVNVHATGNEPYTLIPGSPGITYDFQIGVQSQGYAGNVTLDIGGELDGFPGYEILIARPETGSNEEIMVWHHDPRDTGQTGWSLFPPTEFKVNEHIVVKPKEKP